MYNYFQRGDELPFRIQTTPQQPRLSLRAKPRTE
jgi:hypothetical protein